jgi:hypothetical protein
MAGGGDGEGDRGGEGGGGGAGGGLGKIFLRILFLGTSLWSV